MHKSITKILSSQQPVFTTVCMLVITGLAQADMQSLDDRALAEVQGQSGITLEMDLSMSADRLSYYDDGKGVHIEGIKIGSSEVEGKGAFHRTRIDIASDASLNLEYLVEDRRIEFSDIRLGGAPGVSLGAVFLQHSLDGFFNLRKGGVAGNGYTFDTAYTMTGGRLGYQTNGNSVFLDDITMGFEALGVTLDVIGNTLQLAAPEVKGQWSAGAIRFSDNPADHGVGSAGLGPQGPSYGALAATYNVSSTTGITAGGREGQGLTIDNETIINSASFIYTDDGNVLALRDITGEYRIADLRLDVGTDWNNRSALALTLSRLSVEVNIGAIEMGGIGKSMGSVNMNFILEDSVFNGEAYSNALYIQGGGHSDAGPQGLRLAAEWSLSSANLSYIEDGNQVIVSGLQSWGRGDVTVNVTRDETRNGTRFYDGLRIGFEGLKAGYRINGLRVGSEDAPLQGGTELLLALGVYPAYEFEMDGHVTLGPGGSSGDGLTLNSDIYIRNGKAAVVASPFDEGGGEVSQKGIWLTGVSYEGHVRDMTIDVAEEGLVMQTGEAWSTMDVSDVRVGSSDDGASFGRFRLQSFEKGSSMTLSPGGAGDVCVGGSGASAAACVASGGTWEERGQEGVSIGMKKVLARAEGADKRNSILWETNRNQDSQGNGLNGTGTGLLVDDIHTSDGGDFNGDGIDDNTFGIQTDLSVDVYQTRVTKKEDGPDSHGVIGNKGDEKIMDPSSPQGYRYVSTAGAADIANRPLGFAVKAESRFKELSINNVDLIHRNGGAQTAIYGVKLQNFDIRANLTATPIP
ncbi:DUF6160 family protein [Marinobacter sp. SBS5]|uniref:DUF6160 family protein n=1 Tax=Marinobacter sp. SBS5 TaxID=3401754 RepID=UPI003AB0370C